jgi:hypothetical protein
MAFGVAYDDEARQIWVRSASPGPAMGCAAQCLLPYMRKEARRERAREHDDVHRVMGQVGAQGQGTSIAMGVACDQDVRQAPKATQVTSIPFHIDDDDDARRSAS